MAQIMLAGRPVGDGHQPYVIAEIGVNHNGKPELAAELIDAAAAAGADAAKLQAFAAAQVARADAPQAAYQRERAVSASQLAMLQSLELTPDAMRSVAAHATARGITFFASPFDLASVELLVDIDVPAFKVGSGDVTNLPLLRAVARTGRPVILSTGMSELIEVDAAVSELRASGCRDLAVLQCTSAYPAPSEVANLRVIRFLRDRYGAVAGYSDHTTGTTTSIAAVALGAAILEKHITLDTSLRGPDHAASLDPNSFAAYVSAVHEAHSSLGTDRKVVAAAEMDVRRVARRSLVLRRSVMAGTVLEAADLDAKRPADGLSPMQLDRVVGRRLARDVAADALLHAEDLEPA